MPNLRRGMMGAAGGVEGGYSLWASGRNDIGGALGLSDAINRSSPVQVGEGAGWEFIDGGPAQGFGIKSSGAFFSWGNNSHGRLGTSLALSLDQSSPVQVGSLTDWSKVRGGGESSGLKTDGTLWGWGNNNKGQLGQGDVIARSSPVQVGSLTTWESSDSGGTSTRAIKTDGTLWAWGWNAHGQIGQDDILDYSSPVQIGSLTTWHSVSSGAGSHIIARLDNGALYTWGRGDRGKLGLGELANKSSPTQVGSLTDWAGVSGGAFHCAAVKSDGTLWTWGQGTQGQLGLGDAIDYSSPVQVGSLTTWSKVSAGYQNTRAITTSGTIFTWGLNAPYSQGALGLGDIINRSSPVQIGTDSDWVQVKASGGQGWALKESG